MKNLKTLSRAFGCDEKASKFADLINQRSGKGTVIDRSYISRIFKDSEKDPANPSLEKLVAISDSLNVDAWQLINPMGFDSDGRSRANNNSIDTDTFKRALRYALLSAEELEVEDFNFISEVALSSYISMLTGDEERLGINVAKLARDLIPN